MSRHAVSDDVLRMMVGIKIEAGVDPVEVHRLIDEYAAQEPQAGGDGETFGFLWVEDVPHSLRAEFLSALSNLAPDPDLPRRRVAAVRSVSANDIWPSRIAG